MPAAQPQPTPGRSRLSYALLMIVVMGLGLASRSRQIPWPHFITAYAGDTLWALLVFLGFAVLFPRSAPYRLALSAAVFSLLIELSQLYHAPWLDALRHQRLAALVLGQGFLWSDLICYALGIAIGTTLDQVCVLLRNKQDLQA